MEPRCIPCALRRLLATAGRISDDEWVHHKLLVNAMSELVHIDRDRTPAELIAELQSVVVKTLGTTDPYQQDRSDWWQELENCKDPLRARVAAAADPLRESLRMATAANVLDDERLSRTAVREALRWMWGEGNGDQPDFKVEELARFRKDLARAEKLLFVHDSGPEVAFDRLLIEQLLAAPHDEGVTRTVRCVVRSQPILLDALREDLDRSGLLALPGVEAAIDPGITTLGVPLDECGREIRESFASADLILAKGQASYETLHDAGLPAYFALRTKCAVMGKVQGVGVGQLVFVKG